MVTARRASVAKNMPMSRRVTILLAACLAAAGAGCEGPATEADGPRLLAVGNPNNLFVVDVADGRFRPWQGDAAGAWHPCEPVEGTPQAVAAYRERLAVFFPSGRCGLFGLGRPDVQEPPVPGWRTLALAEDGLALDALGRDPDGNPLYARWDGSGWTRRRIDAALPSELAEPTAVRHLGRLYLLWREPAAGGFLGEEGFRVRFAWLDEEGWRLAAPSRIRLQEGPSVAAAAETMVCLYRKPGAGDAPGRWAVATYETTDEDFHETAEVNADAELPEGRLALARWGDRFVLAARIDGGPAVAELDPETGEVEAFEPVQAEKAPPSDRTEGAIEVIVFGVVLAGLLVLVARGRQVARQAKAGQAYPEGVVPASLWRRGGAAVVDHLLSSMAVALVLLAAWPGLRDRVLQGPEPAWQELLPIELIGFAGVVLYFAVAEVGWGRTLGKALFGLEVRAVSGEKATTGRLVARNVLRLFDWLPTFYFVGTISILVGPRPQRLGDRAAGTLVVLRTPPGG